LPASKVARRLTHVPVLFYGPTAATQGDFMAQPARHAPNLLEAAVEQAISICDGDVRAALRALLIANSFLADEVERLTKEVSVGFARGRISPAKRSQREAEPLARNLGR
jgi:hypothetical protein